MVFTVSCFVSLAGRFALTLSMFWFFFLWRLCRSWHFIHTRPNISFIKLGLKGFLYLISCVMGYLLVVILQLVVAILCGIPNEY